MKGFTHVALNMFLCFITSANAAPPAGGKFLYVSACSGCRTTADFIAGASATASGLSEVNPNPSGTYVMSSTTNAESAFIWVTGETVVEGPGKSTWKIVSTVPVDDSGYSLAGESESEQEAVYSAIDITLMGEQRFAESTNIFVEDGSPDWGHILNTNWPTSNDVKVANALSYYLEATDTTPPPGGSTITLIIEPGLFGDPSQYSVVYAVSYSGKTLVLTFISATKNGVPCNRQGVPTKSVTVAANGGGSANLSGGQFGGSIGIGGGDSCLSTTTVTWMGVTYHEEHYTSCH